MTVTRRHMLMTCGTAIMAQAMSGKTAAALFPASSAFEVLRTRLSDGTVLIADLYRPARVETFPVVLVRTSYGRRARGINLRAGMIDITTLLGAGFGVVIQDVRGTGDSGGEFIPLANETADGAETIRQLARQPWSNGDVKTIGGSYLGFTQFASAVAGDSPLSACVYVNTSPDGYRGWFYTNGGVFSLENSDRYAYSTAVAIAAKRGDQARQTQLAAIRHDRAARLMADKRLAARELASEVPWYGEVIAHPLRDAYWSKLSYLDRFDNIRAEGLHIGGWFDFFAPTIIEAFQNLRTDGATEKVREGQYLVMGPWSHMDMTGIYGSASFGDRSGVLQIDTSSIIMDFLSNERGKRSIPRVLYFLMGANEWHSSEAFPPPGSSILKLAFSSGTSGPSLMSGTSPAGSLKVAVDPANPVPTLGGRLLLAGDKWTSAGPDNQQPLQRRKDVAHFASAPFKERCDIVGQVMVDLSVSTDMPDADITVIVTDIDPDGNSRYLTQGVARLSLREGPDKTCEVMPKTVYELRIDAGVTANAFLPGHSMGLNIAGTNFPDYEINPAIKAPGHFELHFGKSTGSFITAVKAAL